MAGLLASAAALRLWNLGRESAWADEVHAIFLAKAPLEIVAKQSLLDNHPPLHYLMLKVWMLPSGPSIWYARLLSAVAGVALVYAVYRLGRLLFGERSGLVAGLLATLSPFLLYYSQEARMYVFFGLFAVLSLEAYWRVLHGAGRRAWWGYVAAATLVVYSMHFGLLVVAAQGLHFGILWLRRAAAARERAPRLLKAWGTVALFCLPALALLAVRVVFIQTAGFHLDRPSLADLLLAPAGFLIAPQIVRGPIDVAVTLTLTALLAAAAVAALARGGRPEERPPPGPHAGTTDPDARSRQARLLLVLALLAPILAPFLASQVSTPVFLLRAFLPTAAVFLVLAGHGLAGIPRPRLRTVVIAVAVSLFAGTLVPYETQPKKHEWRDAVAFVDAQALAGDLVLTVHYPEDLVTFHTQRDDLVIRLLPASALDSAEKIRAATAGHARVWLLMMNDQAHDNAAAREALAQDSALMDGRVFRWITVELWVQVQKA